MIGRLSGILLVKKPPFLLIDVQGVGYEVQAPMSTIYLLPKIKEPIVLFTHLHVREDIQLLYGFYEESERALFRSLIKISGVGPKMALGILSGMDIKVFIQCVEKRDTSLLTRLPGIGKKTAERLIIEMAGKLKSDFLEEGEFSQKLFNSTVKDKSMEFIDSPSEEAIAALMALGYKSKEAREVVSYIEEEGLEAQELIRRALQHNGRA